MPHQPLKLACLPFHHDRVCQLSHGPAPCSDDPVIPERNRSRYPERVTGIEPAKAAMATQCSALEHHPQFEASEKKGWSAYARMFIPLLYQLSDLPIDGGESRIRTYTCL
jgi:hypothetical protein